MKMLPKMLVTAAAVAGLGLAAITFAGPGGGHGPMMGEGMGDCQGHGRMGAADKPQRMERMQQRHAERMELLEARLKLKPEQQDSWKAFQAAQTAQHAAMMAMRQDMRDPETSAQAHFDERVQFMEQRLAGMKTVQKAAGDLYASLDPDQKQVMDTFFTERPMRRMMREQAAAPPAPPAQ